MWGRKFLVAPSRLIVPGVLNGSRGALYYPPDEIKRTVDSWNGIPLVAYHPVVNGRHASARRPDVLRDSGIGFVFNSNWSDALGAEAWFDVELTRSYDRRLSADRKMLPRLERNEPIELSTGLFTDNHPAPKGATYNGRAYDFVAKSQRPDHLAVLPDQKGACSVKDGCGVLATRTAVRGIAVNEDRATKLRRLLGLTENERAKVSPAKACQIVKDGTANGHKLTKKQRGMFGAICGERTNNAFCKTGKGGGIDPSCGKGGGAHTAYAAVTALSDKLAADADKTGKVPSRDEVKKMILGVIGDVDHGELYKAAGFHAKPKSKKDALDKIVHSVFYRAGVIVRSKL